jgi:hypothetical protein
VRVVVGGEAPLWAQQLENSINAALQSVQMAIKPPRIAKANLPTSDSIRLAIVTDEVGGEVLAFLDSAGAWRRATDRAIVS